MHESDHGPERSPPVTGAAESDPKRHFGTNNCRTAKGSFDHLVGRLTGHFFAMRSRDMTTGYTYR